MKAHVVEVPRVNANDETVKLVAWLVHEWDAVTAGQPIASIETTKAVVEVEADAAGLLVPAASAGDMLPLGAPLAFLLSSRDEALAARLRAERRSATADAAHGTRPVSAKARALMAEHGIAVADVPGDGAIREKDVAAVIEARSSAALNAGEQDAAIDGLDVAPASVLLFGAALQAEVVIDCIAAAGTHQAVVLVDDRPKVRSLAGVPVVSSEHVDRIRSRGVRQAHICIGNGAAKLRVGERLAAAGFDIVNVTHPSAVVSSSATFGRGVFVGPLALVGPHVRLGHYVQINNAATVAHHCVIGDAARISDAAHLGGGVTIGERAFIGIGVTINTELKVGADTTIVSGAHVFGDVPPRSIVRVDGKAYPQREAPIT